MDKSLCIACENPSLFTDCAAAGCDEVILSLRGGCFSALRSFGENELVSLIPKAHESGLAVSVLMNRLFAEEEIEAACETMKTLVSKGADHIVFADTALAYEAEKSGMMNRMVYSPETMMTSSPDAQVWNETGVSALMISGLLTREEVIQIVSSVPDAGLNIHGYQLMSVSARPLLSSYAANRGLAPLTGRTDLSLAEEKRSGRMPVYENEYCTMIFSDYILESFDEMKDFLKAGAKRFVIDSFRLDTECVLDTVAVYRAFLDEKQTEDMVKTYRQKYNSLPLSGGYYEQKTVR